jgi:DNA-binding NarL/FixJ family response regulator
MRLDSRKEMSTEKIQVFIASLQSLFQQGIKHSLADVPDIEIMGVGGVGSEVMSTVDTAPPDVALVDIDGPSDDGLTLARKIKQRSPNIGVIVLTSNPNDAQLFQSLKTQAVAYLSKEVTADQLAETVRRVARGEHPINESLTTRPKVAEQVLHQFQQLYWRSEARNGNPQLYRPGLS